MYIYTIRRILHDVQCTAYSIRRTLVLRQYTSINNHGSTYFYIVGIVFREIILPLDKLDNVLEKGGVFTDLKFIIIFFI